MIYTLAKRGFSALSPIERRGLIGFCFSIVFFAAAFTADAAAQSSPDDEPMVFVVVRSSTPGCEPTCPEWISAEGGIVAKTPAQLKNLLKTLGGRKLPIVVSSPGGDVDAAMALGRLIRQNKLDTAVGKTRFLGCQPSDKNCDVNDGKGTRYLGTAHAGGAFCNSACPLMLAGGVRRVVGQWAFLGVHQITTTFVKTQLTYRTKYKVVKGKKRVIDKKVVGRKNVGSYKTYEMGRAVERKLAAYLKEMGVDQSILETIKSTPASSIQRIAPFDLLKSKLVTSFDAVDLLTAAEVCKTVPAAANCRVFTVSDLKQSPATPVLAAKSPASEDTSQMRFVVVRFGGAGCEPTCSEWISAEGEITAKTPALFKGALKYLGGRKLPVVVSSPGGSADAAMALGRAIRKEGLVVAVGLTSFFGCQPADKDCRKNYGKGAYYIGSATAWGARCTSECALVLAGGVRRMAGASTVVGPVPTTGASKAAKRKLAAYLDEMGVQRSILGETDITGASRQFVQMDLDAMRLLTTRFSVERVIADICKHAPAPDNCRVFTTQDLER